MHCIRFVFGLVLVSMVILPTLAVCQAVLPQELKHLETLVDDETKLVEASRRVHRTQIRLIGWDESLQNRFNQQEHPDLAETKAMDVQERARLVGSMWQYVLGYFPHNAIANNYYGEYLYDYGGDVVHAMQLWRLASQYNPKYAHPFNNLGLHYFHTGQIDRGLDHLKVALDLEPDNPDFLYNMSQMYLLYFPQLEVTLKTSKDKLYKKAMDMSRRATELDPNDFDLAQDYATNFYAAEQYGAKTDWVKAAQAWQTAAPLARNDEERFFCFLNEGRSWLNADNSQNASQSLKRALTIRPDSRVAAQLMEKIKSASTPQS